MFRIGETDFGIDSAKSKCSLSPKRGLVTLDAEIYGDKQEYGRITADEDSPWSWTLYPPHFYLRKVPVEVNGRADAFAAKVTADDLDEYEVAIYLMEHNDVDTVSIEVDGGEFTANGTVFLSGKPLPFAIRFSIPRAS